MTFIRISLLALLLQGLLTSCGGAAGGGLASAPGGGGGIGGSGVVSTGTIDGFGSIYVNGVKFDTDEADIVLDGVAAGADLLRLGMVVTVVGSVDRGGMTGTADKVIFDDQVEGPVQSVVAGPDASSLLVSVMGVQVVVQRGDTVVDGTSADELAEGDLVEVSGYPIDGQQLQATRIEKRAEFVPGDSPVELRGEVAQLDATTFRLGETVVDYSGAMLEGLPGGALSDGAAVKVRGTLSGNVITATRVEGKADTGTLLAANDAVQASGVIFDFAGAERFRVGDLLVDASGAQLKPADLELRNDVPVQVQGVWNGTLLVATKVESRQVQVTIAGGVSAVDPVANRITLRLVPGEVTVAVDTRTRFDNVIDTPVPVGVLTLNEISVGDFLEVNAIADPNAPLARRVDRVRRGDEVLQGPVQWFNPEADITLLGLTFVTTDAQFMDHTEAPLTAQGFYDVLRYGHRVRVRDAYPADGFADVVRFVEDPNTVPLDPNGVPPDPNTLPEDPNSVPEDPNSVPEDPNSLPEDPNSVPRYPPAEP